MAYEAEIAGLQWSIEPVPHSIAPGLAIRVSGYSDTMRTLLQEVLGAINKLEIKKDRFDITKERYTRGLRNWKTKQPYQWASRLREEAMHVGMCLHAFSHNKCQELALHIIHVWFHVQECTQ